MLRQTLFIGLFFCLFLTQTACDRAANGQTTQTPADSAAADSGLTAKPEPAAPPADRYWNDLARYLAGRDPLPGSVLNRIENRPEAEAHRAFFKAKWEKKNDDLYNKLVKFGNEEFPTEQQAAGTVLYPFSGPDFITVNTLFPKASKYVMFGLEPEGNLPDINKIPDNALEGNLKNIQHSLDAMVKQSFFMTNEMRVDFRRKELNGTTPIILLFMSLRDLTILDVKHIKVDEKGDVVYLPKDDSVKQTTEDTLITGMEIKFRAGDAGPEQTLQYWSFDASDRGDKELTYWTFMKRYNMHRYLRNLKPTTTYIKSASYLLHGGHFATVRNVVMDISEFFLQDDTGVPYKLFKNDPKNKWEVKLYGNYQGTLPQFSYAYQADLAAKYASDTSARKELGFKMGYNNRFNLQIARKIK